MTSTMRNHTNTSRKACCSALPNQCRGDETCVEDAEVDGHCAHASCIAIQYWVNEVGLKLNPSQMYTGTGGTCGGSWCEGKVCRTGENSFTCVEGIVACPSPTRNATGGA